MLTIGEQVGKTRASLNAAYELYGRDKVDPEIAEFSKLFDGNEVVQARVLRAEMPVVEAIRVMKEYRFVQKYGNDTDKIAENIRKTTEDELTPAIVARVTKEIMARMQKKDDEPKTIRDARATADGGQKAFTPTPMTSIFNN